jgi:hypothetical protein
MNRYDKAWQKLAAAARRAPDEGDLQAPYGFSTRVAARAFEQRPASSIFGRVAIRVALVTCLLAVAAVGANYGAIRSTFADDETTVAVSSDDPVDEVVNLGS